MVWYPSLMLFFGLGPASKIAFGVLLGFFPVVLAVLAGIRSVDPHLLTVARGLGAGPRTCFVKVILPAITATLVAGLRAGLALTVVGVLVGEILGARGGLGYLINYAYGLLRTADYAALALLALGLVLVVDGVAAWSRPAPGGGRRARREPPGRAVARRPGRCLARRRSSLALGTSPAAAACGLGRSALRAGAVGGGARRSARSRRRPSGSSARRWGRRSSPTRSPSRSASAPGS